MKKIVTFVFIIAASIMMISCDSEAQENPAVPYLIPQGAEEVIIGLPGKKIDIWGNSTDILKEKTEAKLSQAEWQNDPRKLVIIKKNGKYYWLSNGNVELHNIQKTLSRGDKPAHDYRIFTNTNGLGIITLRLDDYQKRSCYRDIENNYMEYKLSDYGRYEVFYGSTQYNVYPPPPNPDDWCPMPISRD